jgi:hypothetical protein
LIKPKFKEADVVKVINEWYINHYNKQGEVIYIHLGKDNKTYIYDVYFEGENCTLPITEESLQIAE